MGAVVVPPGADLVIELVNTCDVEGDADELGDSAGAGWWLVEKRLVGPGTVVRTGDRERLVRLREALRALLLANHDRTTDRAALASFNDLAVNVPLVVALDGPGDGRLEPVGRGVDQALGRVLGAVFAATADGTWWRLKACRSDTCQWAFYDQSKNQSRTWCDMAVCGSRAKAKAYRRRGHDQ